MAWQHFSARKNAVSRVPPATVANSATVHSSKVPSVATVATVAALHPENATPTVADVATVAAPHSKNVNPSVATVATVAGVHPKTAIFPAVPLEEVALLFERIVSDLMGRGATRLDAEADALPVLRSRLANDARIAISRPGTGMCAICGEPEKQGDMLLPVLTGRPNSHVWLHGGECHAAYREEIAAIVDALIAEAVVR